MLLSLLRKIFPDTVLYVALREERLIVINATTREIFDEPPRVAIQTLANGSKKIIAIGRDAIAGADVQVVNPLSHPRVLLADFQVGETLLKYAFHKLMGKWYRLAPPRVVMHPLEKTEGGLTEIELRALREVALGAGAREIWIYTGEKPLTVDTFDLKTLLSQST